VEVRMRFVRSKVSFCIMESKTVSKIRILDASLLVRRAKISPGVLLAHARMLSKTTAKYPLMRVEVKTFTIHADVVGESIDNAILGQLRKRVIVGFVENKAFNGDRKLNPFNFKNYGINFFSLYVDGMQIPSRPLQPNFSKDEYADGYTLFAFDLTPDLSANCAGHWNLMKQYSRGQEKTCYLRNLLSRNAYNLERISPAFKNLPDFEDRGQRCTHHGFQTNAESHCALRNAYKLKHWLTTIRNNSNSSYKSLPSENWSESDVESETADSRNFSIQFKNQKHDISRNIEAWKNIATEKTKQNENEQATGEEKKDLLEFDPPTDRDKAITNVSRRLNFENSRTSAPPKERSICEGLSCRPTAEGVDEEPSYDKRLISEKIHIKRQKQGLNKQAETKSLPESYLQIIQSLSPS
ncbi:Uncharacterized protein F54H12.2, partial [Trachymyrmex zeteki]